jgi:quercetin dioxygenase-like cupin family protein
MALRPCDVLWAACRLQHLGFVVDEAPMSMDPRVFCSANFLQPNEGEPIRSVVTQSSEATVVAWCVRPGQRIAAHVHPQGQDTWTVLSGQGQYQVDASGATRHIGPGDIAVAHTGQVHGVHNVGHEPLVFISVVAPAEAGYQLL